MHHRRRAFFWFASFFSARHQKGTSKSVRSQLIHTSVAIAHVQMCRRSVYIRKAEKVKYRNAITFCGLTSKRELEPGWRRLEFFEKVRERYSDNQTVLSYGVNVHHEVFGWNRLWKKAKKIGSVKCKQRPVLMRSIGKTWHCVLIAYCPRSSCIPALEKSN